MWNYGKEVWCNRKGRYTTIVVDVTSAPTDTSVKICSVGVMGTKYLETYSPPDSAIVVDQGAMKSIEAALPTVDPLYAIGNEV